MNQNSFPLLTSINLYINKSFLVELNTDEKYKDTFAEKHCIDELLNFTTLFGSSTDLQ